METLTFSTFPPALLWAFFPPSQAWWMLRIFQGLCLNCLPCSLALSTLSNGLCIGGTYMSRHFQRLLNVTLSFIGGWPPSSHCAENAATGMCPCPSLHWAFSILYTPLLLPSPLLSPDKAALSLSPLKSPSPSMEGGGKNQYNTKQWLIGLRVQCAERSLLYIMYGGQLMVSVLADKWTVSISPVWWSHRGDACTHTNTMPHMHLWAEIDVNK